MSKSKTTTPSKISEVYACYEVSTIKGQHLLATHKSIPPYNELFTHETFTISEWVLVLKCAPMTVSMTYHLHHMRREK